MSGKKVQNVSGSLKIEKVVNAPRKVVYNMWNVTTFFSLKLHNTFCMLLVSSAADTKISCVCDRCDFVMCAQGSYQNSASFPKSVL